MDATRIPPILLVEDDTTLSEITAFRLELLGYSIVAMQSAEQALQWLEEDLPSVVVVDLTLPGMDGFEFVNRLSNDLRTSEIPVMAISTNSDLEDVQKAFNAGADEYLVIPYDPLVMEMKVEGMLRSATAAMSR